MKILRHTMSHLLITTLALSMLYPIGAYAAADPTIGQAVDQTADQSQLSFATRERMEEIIKQNSFVDGQKPILHPDLQNLTGDKDITVIVELTQAPVALEKGMSTLAGKKFTESAEKLAEQKVLAQQQNFFNQLDLANIDADVRFTYDYAINGISLTVKANQVEQLLQLDGIERIEPVVERHIDDEPSSEQSNSYLSTLDTETLTKQPSTEAASIKPDAVSPMMNVSSPYLNVPDLWNLGYEGQHVKVAVLDTGIDYYHPEFQGVYKGGYNFVVQTVNANTGYARARADNDPYETTKLDWPRTRPETSPETGGTFYTMHGTHVAGTIAAQGNNIYGIKGIAPKVELYSYRVLGAYGSGSNDQIIAGIDKAVEEKMDVINLSLGGSNNSQTSVDAAAINNAALAGVTACISSGNNGPTRGSLGSPGVAAFAITVGNSTTPSTHKTATANITLNGATKSYPMDMNAWTFGTDPESALNGDFDLVAVPNLGDEPDYEGLNVVGKVVLVSRGTLTFKRKVDIAKAHGAAAIIIHNSATGTNSPGPANGDNHLAFMWDSFGYIPDFDMSYTDGIALRNDLAVHTATVNFSEFTSTITNGDEINDSSSRGPGYPVFDIKPDVVAPGTDIMSSIPAYGKDYVDSNSSMPDGLYAQAYERETGTSMSCPHVTGIVALIKSEHPDWTPFDFKVALSNTAKQLDVTKYDVFSQGAGRVQPLKAATTEALAYSLDTSHYTSFNNLKGTITFGNVAVDSNKGKKVTREILVKSLTGSPSDYTVTVQTTKHAKDTNVELTVDKSSFTLTDEQKLIVTLTIPKGTDTTNNELLGYVKITNGTTNLNLPFAANLVPSVLKSFTIDNNHISPNEDGKLDSTTIKYEFNSTQFITRMEIYDLAHPTAGDQKNGYLGWIVNQSLTQTGLHSVNFNGNYVSWGLYSAILPDGVYMLELETYDYEGTTRIADEWLPIYIKTSNPTIVAANQSVVGSNYLFSGSIDDPYLTFGSTLAQYRIAYGDANQYLHVKYELRDSRSSLISALPVKLDQDGKFNLPLNGLTPGVNNLKLIVDDAAGNHTEKVITITSNSSSVIEVTGVSLDQPMLTFTEGGTPQALTATVSPSDATNKDVIWSSSNSDVAAVNSAGVVTPGAVGTATITVTTVDGGYSATSQVAVSAANSGTTPVNVSVTSVTLNQDKLLFAVGDAPIALTATVNPTNATNKAVTWSSSSSDVASVDSSGVVTPGVTGTAIITVTTVDGGKTATSRITVSPRNTSGSGGNDGDSNVPDKGSSNNSPTPSSPIPSNPIPSNPDPSHFTYVLDNKAAESALIQAKVNKQNHKVITIDVTKDSQAANEVSVNFPYSLLDSAENRSVIVQTSFASIEIPSLALKKDQVGSSANLTVSLEKLNPALLASQAQAKIGSHPVVNASLAVNNQAIAWSNDEVPIKISIPYKPSAEENKNTDQLIVYEVDNNGGLSVISNSNYGAESSAATFAVHHLNTFGLSFTQQSFSDTQSSWAKKEIEALAVRNIITGTTADTFLPRANISRGDFTKLLVGVLGIKAPYTATEFSDVPSSAYYYDSIMTAKALGLATGLSNNKFNPGAQITRQEMMTLIDRALSIAGNPLTEKNSLSALSDAKQVAPFAADSAAKLVAAGIIQGNNGKLRPQDHLSREEAAKVLYSVFKLLFQE